MTASRPDALVFDWDNTLVDSWQTIHDALNGTLAAMGHATWTIGETKERVRQSLRDSFPKLFGERWEEARRIYLTTFEAIHLDRLRPLPGAAAMLESLHASGCYLALVSNKTGRLLRLEVEALGWAGLFRRVVGAGDAPADKPHRAPMDLALEGSGFAAGQAVWFVGDTGLDMEFALNAGCVPVLVHSAAPDGAAGGEFLRARPALQFQDCSALADAILSSPTCNEAAL